MSVCTDCNDDSHQCTECGNAYFSIPCEQWHDKEQVTFNGGVKYGEWKGYAACLADVVAWLRKTGDWFSDITDNGQCEHGNYSWEGCETCGIKGVADAIERGEAKGASNE